MATVPAFLILACLANEAAARELSAARWAMAGAGLGVCLVLVAATDFLAVRRDRTPNLAQEAARQILPEVRAGDLVLTVDTEKGAYFDLYLIGRGGSVHPVNLDLAIDAAERAGTGPFTPAVVEEIVKRWRDAQAREARCYVDAWLVRGDISAVRYMKALDAAQFRSLFEQTFPTRPLTVGGTPLVYEITAR